MIRLKEERGIWERVTTTVASQDTILRPAAMERGRWSSRWKHMKLLISICFFLCFFCVFFFLPTTTSPLVQHVYNFLQREAIQQGETYQRWTGGSRTTQFKVRRASCFGKGSTVLSSQPRTERDICNLTHLVYGQLRSPHSCSSPGLPHFPSQPP